MNIWFYDASRQFLEQMIKENPANVELVKAYSALVGKFAEVEIAYSAHQTDYGKNHDKNQADVAKNYQSAQADIVKKQLDKGVSLPYVQQSSL